MRQAEGLTAVLDGRLRPHIGPRGQTPSPDDVVIKPLSQPGWSSFAKSQHVSTTFARCRFRRPRVGRFVQRISLDNEDLTTPQSQGWQWVGVVWPRLTPSEQALSRSQGGPMAGTSFQLLPCVTPVSVRCPGFPGSSLAALLVPTSFVRCKLTVGRPLDSVQLVIWLGFWGHRGFSLESAAARMCREAGARVSLNVRVHDLDLLLLGRPDN